METRICRLHAAHDLRIESQPVFGPGPDDVQIAVGAGGICGSDLHYFHDGGIGQVRVREPIIVGHEAAGNVLEVGEKVAEFAAGDLVAINPSLPCGQCHYCKKEEFNHCTEMRFMGSAYRMPHEQGMFRDFLTVPAARVHRFTNPIPVNRAACAEPLAVCLHAEAQADCLHGRRVLITGAGPIGALMTSVVGRKNPRELIVTDLHDYPLSVAKTMGAFETINVAYRPKALESFRQNKGQFDVVFECTGSPAAIADAMTMLRPRGTMVLVGVAGEISLALNVIVSKEIRMLGTHRFHPEFAKAVKLIDSDEINVDPIISRSFNIEDATAAFEFAGDRTQAIKVHLTFEEGRNS